MEENFIECDTVAEANEISLKQYVFYGFRQFDGKNVYVFKVRMTRGRKKAV